MYIGKSPYTTYKNIAKMYVSDFNNVKGFFEYDYNSLNAFSRRVDYINNDLLINREVLVKMLYGFNKRLNGGENTLINIQRLMYDDVYAVVTGQQPGIFTGPLYTIYKALTTVILSRYLNDKIGIKTVPVFWIAGEDHDFYEISHISYLDKKNNIKKIKLDGNGYGKASVGTVKVTEYLLNLIDMFYKDFDGYPGQETLNVLKETAEVSYDINDWFGRLMLYLFREQGLIMVDSMDPLIKSNVKEVFSTAVERHTQINNTLIEAKYRLETICGFSAPIKVNEASTNLFLYNADNRRLLLKDKDLYGTVSRELEFDEQGIKKLIDKEPWNFSPNVVIRPIVQDRVLPTIAYVAGPGEIAYYAQIKEVYGLFDMKMPVIYPRNSYTIVSPENYRVLKNYNLTIEQGLNGTWRKIQEDLLESRDNVGLTLLFDDMKNHICSMYDKAACQLKVIDPNLEKLAQENRERVIKQIEYLEDKAFQHHRRNNKQILNEFLFLSRELYPNNQHQERVFNMFYYLGKYGINLVDSLIEISDLSAQHRILYIEEKDVL